MFHDKILHYCKIYFHHISMNLCICFWLYFHHKCKMNLDTCHCLNFLLYQRLILENLDNFPLRKFDVHHIGMRCNTWKFQMSFNFHHKGNSILNMINILLHINFIFMKHHQQSNFLLIRVIVLIQYYYGLTIK